MKTGVLSKKNPGAASSDADAGLLFSRRALSYWRYWLAPGAAFAFFSAF